MNQKSRTLSSDYQKVVAQVDDSTPEGIIDAIVTQIARAREAKNRIETEGLVVRDMRGSVIAHPAIQIEIAANKIICDLLAKHKALFD